MKTTYNTLDRPDFVRQQYQFAAYIRNPEHNSPPEAIEVRRMKIYAELFYNNALSDEEVLKLMGRYGITKEKLAKGLQLVIKVKEANEIQEAQKTVSYKATGERKKAFDDLFAWLSEFFQVCKFALASRPELLERVGVPVPSEEYREKITELTVEEEEEEEAN